jgi:hypothetical protein
MGLFSLKKTPVIFGLAALFAACPKPMSGQDLSPSEYEIKAAFVFNFAKFVTWPEKSFTSPDQPFTIGILGRDPFGDTLEDVIGDKTVQGRKIEILRLRRLQGHPACHILFIAESERPDLRDILSQLEGTGVLTVSDMPEFAARGGMIQLVMENYKVRFAIHTPSAERAGLKISAKLLSLAITPSD